LTGSGPINGIRKIKLVKSRAERKIFEPGILFHIRKHIDNATHVLFVHSRGQAAVGVLEVVGSDTQLFQAVGAGHPVGRFADLLHCRQQQRDQDPDDGDHHQQLDQSKSRSAIPVKHDSSFIKRNNDAEKRSILKIPQLVSLEEYTRHSLWFRITDRKMGYLVQHQ
jgi:hypothetical protein